MPKSEKQRKLRLFRFLGANLINQGQKFLKKSFTIKYRKVSSGELQSALKQKYEIPDEKIYCADSYYWLTDLKTWKELIKYDFTDKKKYLKQRYDCDNFAGSFSAHMAEIYELNSAGLARWIEILNKDKERTGWHRANIISALVDNKIRAYLYEPQTDALDEIVDYKEPLWQTGRYNKFSKFEFN